MSDDEAPLPPPAPVPPVRRRRFALIIATIILAPILIFSIYAGVTLHWSYSNGARAGIVQKFSHKGWICKTWEGELAMTTVAGVLPTIWNFTVRDDVVAKQVNASLGQRVVLHYSEHRGVPTRCFGDTQYFVDSVRTESKP